MNTLLLVRLLGIISLLIGASMTVSLPWAFPELGETAEFEAGGFWALAISIVLCVLAGLGMMYAGRASKGQTLFRKEALAIVAFSWLLATLYGALPYYLSGTISIPANEAGETNQPMNVWDCIFESASGFTGTGATVINNVEDPRLVPRSILFWRMFTQFLGGLGIMVLFVALLGHGSAGKALMLAEATGPTKDTGQYRVQQAAWIFAKIFIGLNLFCTLALRFQGLSWYDALCHAFAGVGTGGFSTYNLSVGHFQGVPGLNAPLIEMTLVLFMMLGCTNFSLMYLAVLGKPDRLLADPEFRVYVSIIALTALLVASFGLYYHDFEQPMAVVAGETPVPLSQTSWFHQGLESVRFGLFQVVSVITNTGFATADFDHWNGASRGILLVLMFVGSCGGSTSCSIKVIRHMLFLKILWLELEQAFHPSVVRPVRLGGQALDEGLRKNVLTYISLVLVLFVTSWLLLLMIEPDSTWTAHGLSKENKLIDCASGLAATFNCVGPGFGLVGVLHNYSHFHAPAKMLFTLVMLLGRLEIVPLVVIFLPSFWRSR